MKTELLTAIYTLIDSSEGATLRGLVNYYGVGLAPKTADYPVVVWSPTDFEDEYTQTPGADYYETIQIQFNVGTKSQTATTVLQIGEALDDLIRNNPPTLSSGRAFDVNLLASRTFENPEGDGWEYVRIAEYQTGS